MVRGDIFQKELGRPAPDHSAPGLSDPYLFYSKLTKWSNNGTIANSALARWKSDWRRTTSGRVTKIQNSDVVLTERT